MNALLHLAAILLLAALIGHAIERSNRRVRYLLLLRTVREAAPRISAAMRSMASSVAEATVTFERFGQALRRAGARMSDA